MYLCNVIRAGQGEAVPCQLICLGLNLAQFSLHDLFLGFVGCCAETNAIQLQQSQAIMGGHLHLRKYICSKYKQKKIFYKQDQLQINTFIKKKKRRILSFENTEMFSHTEIFYYRFHLNTFVSGIRNIS